MPNIRYPDRTCMDCGNSEEQCECDTRAAARLESKIEEFKADYLSKGFSRCFDCLDLASAYMLTNKVWLSAMPEYPEIRRTLIQWHQATFPERYKRNARGHLNWIRGSGAPMSTRLCLVCVENRLGRHMVLEDFTDVPINQDIQFAHRMGQRRVLKEIGDNAHAHQSIVAAPTDG